MSTSRINPVFLNTAQEIKNIIKQDGYCTIIEFKQAIEEKDIDEELLLKTLVYDGIAFVSSVVGEGAKAEVLVDIRLMAVAQLLAYHNTDYAKNNLVFDYVKAVYGAVKDNAVFVMNFHQTLLSDSYKQHGHRFSISKIAEAANIKDDGGEACRVLLARHFPAINTLVKDDSALTEVYLLAQAAFQITNGDTAGNMRLVHRPSFDKENSPYFSFHQMATVMANKHKPK